MIFAGIDPGSKGGIAILNDNGYPVFARPMPKLYEFYKFFHEMEASYEVWLEESFSKKTDGHNSAWGNGFNYGSYIMALEIIKHERNFDYNTVKPVTWKSAFKLSKDKELSRKLCIDLWGEDCTRLFTGPRGAFLDGNAEAMLIAYYGWLNYKRRIKWAK